MQNQPMETQVKSYDNPKDYQKDLNKMQKQGWSVQNVIDHQQERNLAGKLFVPGGLFTKGKSQIVVTYQRPQGQYLDGKMPKGLSFKEQVAWHTEQRKK